MVGRALFFCAGRDRQTWKRHLFGNGSGMAQCSTQDAVDWVITFRHLGVISGLGQESHRDTCIQSLVRLW